MELAGRIELTRAACRQALESAELAAPAAALKSAGFTPAGLYDLLGAGSRRRQPAAELLALRAQPDASVGAGHALERAILLSAAPLTLDGLAALRTDESVKHLICRELLSYARPPAALLPHFAVESRSFAAMSGIVSLTRFPAGQYQWEVSGLPRRWLAKVPLARLFTVLRFVVRDTGGFSPLFMPHLGGTGPPARIVTARQYYKSFYRMALALERQPEIRGILAVSWMHSRETHRVSPHLAFYNNVYIEAGGLYVELGAARPEDGFLAGDSHRAGLYRAGAYRPSNALVLCSRRQVILWAHANRHLEKEIRIY